MQNHRIGTGRGVVSARFYYTGKPPKKQGGTAYFFPSRKKIRNISL
jgi:hypothetical protein